jgi:endo-1,4-beta-xylanase
MNNSHYLWRPLALAMVFLFSYSQAVGQMANGKPKFLGNIVGNYIPASFDTYWNQITPGNSGKWGSVEATRNVMVWADLDKAYNHALSKNYPFKQHTLVWGNQQPSWLSSLSPSEQAMEVEEWIRLFAERYPATNMIDVVNEPLHVIPVYANAIGGAGTTGWDWVVWTFQKARQYAPTAKLLLNDYGILGSAKATSDYVKIINILKSRGLIDGIGVQGHGLEYAQTSTIERNLATLQATGIPIYVTELDLEHADDATQLSMYQRVFPLLYEHPAVAGVTLWGYIAGEHWKPNAYLLGRSTTVATFTTPATFTDFVVTASGKLQVHLTNDNVNNSNDLEIDFIVNNGTVHEAEQMPLNTGVWTGTCGGSFSQSLHCNGYIQFPNVSGSVTIRAKGTTGSELMEVRVVDETFERPALRWLRNEYFGTGGGGAGDLTMEAENGTRVGTVVSSVRAGFSATGYVTGFDTAGDYVEVTANLASAGTFPLIIRYASDVSIARSVRLNGSVVRKNFSLPASAVFTDTQFNAAFIAGVNTIRIYVERGGASGGDIDQVRIGGAAASTARVATSSEEATSLKIYPNPSLDGRFTIDGGSLKETGPYTVQIYNSHGERKLIKRMDKGEDALLHADLPAGIYFVKLLTNGHVVMQQHLIVRR